MVYKIISEWRSKDGSQHELLVYRYNYTANYLVSYNVDGNILEVKMNAPGQLVGHSTQQLEGN